MDAAWAVGNVGGVKVETSEFGLAPGAVDDEIGGDRRAVTVVIEGDVEAAIGGLDVDDLGVAMDVDADVIATGNEEFDEVGSKPRSGRGPWSTMTVSVPARAAMWANSNEMNPPPTNKIRSGSCSR